MNKEKKKKKPEQIFPGMLCVIEMVIELITSDPTWIVVRQASLLMGFPRQEYRSGLPLPTPGDLPDPRVKH